MMLLSMCFCRLVNFIVCYLCVSCKGYITSIGEERSTFSDIFNCNNIVSVRRSFLFILVISCFVLLWNSLGLPYNYFTRNLDDLEFWPQLTICPRAFKKCL